jgi:hypothetical protein
VWPEEVLPLVAERFRAALTTDVATHQLPAAVNTLAMCVRPLLLSGWGTPEEPAPQLVAEAMMAVLPAIDANDEAKTAAALQFYTAVLAALPALRGADTDEADLDRACFFDSCVLGENEGRVVRSRLCRHINFNNINFNR